MKKETKQFVIYSRKSKFTGKGESIENQIELCRQYIAVHFSQEEADAALVYEDEGFSGGNLERPQFKKMMKDSQKTKFAGWTASAATSATLQSSSKTWATGTLTSSPSGSSSTPPPPWDGP